ncbi:MAG: ABC transporter ATP-binding protein [Anaerolineales bacterium]|nr:ABC transporter ATP-binding protein [Anaerolineales bacterium]
MDAVVEVIGLYKRFPQSARPAVHDLNLAIDRGQLFGLVGPDGAGKTTTLRMLASVLEPGGGRVRLEGHDVVKEAEHIREWIGYMPQNFSLYPDLSVHENLEFFADIHRMPPERKRARIEEMLAFTRLEAFRGRRAANLSGGMKKKLALGCALVHAPRLLFLDEPSTGVDPVSRRELWTILTDVVHQGVTVVLSTPYMDEAERCHRVGMLFDGNLLASGSPEAMATSLPFAIIELKARPRKEMRRIVGALPGIAEWRPVGDRLRLAVPRENGQVEALMQALQHRFADEGVAVDFMRVERPGMEDVFVHLVSERRHTA